MHREVLYPENADQPVDVSTRESMGHWLQPFLQNVLDCIEPTNPTLMAGWQSAENVINQLEAETARWRDALRAVEPPKDAADIFRQTLAVSSHL